jgi:hypothetical protein
MWCYVKDKVSTQTFNYTKLGNEVDMALVNYVSFNTNKYFGFNSVQRDRRVRGGRGGGSGGGRDRDRDRSGLKRRKSASNNPSISDAALSYSQQQVCTLKFIYLSSALLMQIFIFFGMVRIFSRLTTSVQFPWRLQR